MVDIPLGFRMPVHLNGVLMSGGFRNGGGGDSGGGGNYRSAAGLSPGLRQRTASLEMLNNIKFEEKRALIASTLSLNDLLKPSQDYRAHQQAKHATTSNMGTSTAAGQHHAQFSPVGGGGGVGYALYKSNSAVHGYNNVNFLNNGLAEKDLGECGYVFCGKKSRCTGIEPWLSWIKSALVCDRLPGIYLGTYLLIT